MSDGLPLTPIIHSCTGDKCPQHHNLSDPPPRTIVSCGFKATLRLNILIIGCGIGGLSAAYCLSQAGHHITIVESASSISEVGAGVQISPNASRLLFRWGLGRKLAETGVEPDGVACRRHDDGEVIGYRYFGDSMRQIYGAPYYNVHRADLHSMLYGLVASTDRAVIRMDSKVEKVNPSPNPRVFVKLTSGEVLIGDLIIGADGLRSVTRNTVVCRNISAEPTGDAAYRAVINTDDMKMDENLRALVDCQETNVWMGPGRHVVGYCIKKKHEYNLVLVHPSGGSEESWDSEDSSERMRLEFEGFESRVRKLLLSVNKPLKWELMECKPLETWMHHEGRIVLLGDAYHPMLPYYAQGASMAIEDASVLGCLLAHLSSVSDLHRLLRAYEHPRKERTSKTQGASLKNRHFFHLPDGPTQRDRDAELHRLMKSELQRKRKAAGPGTCIDITTQTTDESSDVIAELYAYDADREVERWRATQNQHLSSLV